MIDVKKPRSRVLGRIRLCGFSTKATQSGNEKSRRLDKTQVPQTGQGVIYREQVSPAYWTRLRSGTSPEYWTGLRGVKKNKFKGGKCDRQVPYFGQDYEVVQVPQIGQDYVLPIVSSRSVPTMHFWFNVAGGQDAKDMLHPKEMLNYVKSELKGK